MPSIPGVQLPVHSAYQSDGTMTTTIGPMNYQGTYSVQGTRIVEHLPLMAAVAEVGGKAPEASDSEVEATVTFTGPNALTLTQTGNGAGVVTTLSRQP
jgi:hypothetical protein